MQNMVDPDGRKPRVYIQRNGIGHVFITIGEGKNTRVFSYGRYGAIDGFFGSSITSGRYSPRGEGVLFVGEGSAAADYLHKVAKEGHVVMFTVNTNNEDAINDYYNHLFEQGSMPATNSDKESYLNPNYRVIDKYKLLSNNCVTTSRHGLEASGWEMETNTTIPSFFAGMLHREAEKSEDITYYEEEDARDYLYWLVSILSFPK